MHQYLDQDKIGAENKPAIPAFIAQMDDDDAHALTRIRERDDLCFGAHGVESKLQWDHDDDNDRDDDVREIHTRQGLVGESAVKQFLESQGLKPSLTPHYDYVDIVEEYSGAKIEIRTQSFPSGGNDAIWGKPTDVDYDVFIICYSIPEKDRAVVSGWLTAGEMEWYKSTHDQTDKGIDDGPRWLVPFDMTHPPRSLPAYLKLCGRGLWSPGSASRSSSGGEARA